MTEQEKQEQTAREMALSDVLRPQFDKLIKEKFKSTSALSKAIGVHNSTVTSALAGNIFGVGVGRIIKICHALGVGVDGLAEGKLIPYTPPSEDHCDDELSDDERAIITKYRKLDDRGKSSVQRVLDGEYEYTMKNLVKDTSTLAGTG